MARSNGRCRGAIASKGEVGPTSHGPRHRKVQLLVIDDHRIALDAVRTYLLRHADFAVGTLLNHQLKSPRKLRRAAPDVVMVNMRVQNPDSTTVVRMLQHALPGAKVIGFGNVKSRELVVSMVRAGACGFVSESSSLRQLFRVIRSVSRGDDVWCPSISKIIIEEFRNKSARPVTADRILRLRECERRLLRSIADGHTNKEMAAILGLSIRTVEKYREILMRKLQIKNTAGLTKFAIRAGLSSLE